MATSKVVVTSEGQDSVILDVEAHPREAVAAQPQALIRVLGPDGGPVGGADIVRTGTWQPVGRTNGEGRLAFSTALLKGERVLARADGHAAEFASIGCPAPPETAIILRREWVLTGQVVDSSGRSVGRGVTLLAVGQNDSLPESDVRAALAGRGPLSTATSDERGAFVIAGLHPGVGYRIFAGGQGYCSVEPFSPLVFERDSTRKHIVTVNPVYGVRIDLHDGTSGGKIALGERLNGSWYGNPKPSVDDARTVVSDNWTAALLGLDDSGVSRSAFEAAFFFETSRDHGEAIPVEYEAQFPGYAPIHEHFEARRARNTLAVHAASLQRTATAFGDIELWFDPVEQVPNVIPHSLANRRPELHLTCVETEVLIRAQLRDVERGFERVGGVPAGSYFVELRAPHQLFRYPGHSEGPRILAIGDVPAELRVQLKGLGALRISVLTSSGSAYCGPLSGTHVRAGGQEADDFYFPAPPYTIPLLPQGDYTVSIDLGTSSALELTVQEYQITEGVFTLLDE